MLTPVFVFQTGIRILKTDLTPSPPCLRQINNCHSFHLPLYMQGRGDWDCALVPLRALELYQVRVAPSSYNLQFWTGLLPLMGRISSTYGTDFFLLWYGLVLEMNSSCFLDRFILVLGKVSSISKTKRISFSSEADIFHLWNGYVSFSSEMDILQFWNRYASVLKRISFSSETDILQFWWYRYPSVLKRIGILQF